MSGAFPPPTAPLVRVLLHRDLSFPCQASWKWSASSSSLPSSSWSVRLPAQGPPRTTATTTMAISPATATRTTTTTIANTGTPLRSPPSCPRHPLSSCLSRFLVRSAFLPRPAIRFTLRFSQTRNAGIAETGPLQTPSNQDLPISFSKVHPQCVPRNCPGPAISQYKSTCGDELGDSTSDSWGASEPTLRIKTIHEPRTPLSGRGTRGGSENAEKRL
jgi:hypothetical protein